MLPRQIQTDLLCFQAGNRAWSVHQDVELNFVYRFGPVGLVGLVGLVLEGVGVCDEGSFLKQLMFELL